MDRAEHQLRLALRRRRMGALLGILGVIFGFAGAALALDGRALHIAIVAFMVGGTIIFVLIGISLKCPRCGQKIHGVFGGWGQRNRIEDTVVSLVRPFHCKHCGLREPDRS